MNPTSSTPNYDTSFLPQQPSLRPDSPLGRKEPIAIGMIIALVMFFVTAAVAGGTYLYKKEVESRIAGEKETLANMEQTIDIPTIEKLGAISRRLDIAEKLLSEHVSFVLLLDVLASGTAVNVGYSELQFDGTKGGLTLLLAGIAPSYEAVAFQASALRTRPYTKDVKVEEVSLDVDSGTVVFRMSLELRPDAGRFGRYFEKGYTPGAPASQTPAPSTATASSSEKKAISPSP